MNKTGVFLACIVIAMGIVSGFYGSVTTAVQIIENDNKAIYKSLKDVAMSVLWIIYGVVWIINSLN